MTTANRLLLAALGLVIVCFGLFVVWKEHQISQMQTQLQNSVVQMQQLAGDITRSQSQLVSKDDLQAFATANQVNLDTIGKNMTGLQATLTGINAISVNSTGEDVSGVASTTTTPRPATPADPSHPGVTPSPNGDPFGYQANQQNLALNESFGTQQVPIATVGFQAWQAHPWSLDIYPRKYSVTNTLATKPDGSHLVYSKVIISANGKDYPLTITDARYEETLPSATFSWWNPRLFAYGGAAIDVSPAVRGEFTPGIALGIMSYGKTKPDPDISVLQLGVGYGVVTRAPVFSLNPVNLNIGHLLNTSLIQSTYLGPSLQIDTKGDLGVGTVLSVGF